MSEPETPTTPPAFLNVSMRLEADPANATEGAVREVVEAMARAAGALGFSASGEVSVAFGNGFPESEPQPALSLDTDIDAALRTVSGSSRSHMGSNRLRHRGIARVRDVLVVGRARVGEVPAVGSLTIDHFETVIGMLNTQCPEVGQWKSNPTMADIVRICQSLSNVTAAAICAGLGKSSKGPGFIPAARVTIQDILMMPFGELEKLYKREGREEFLRRDPAGYEGIRNVASASDATLIAFNIRNQAAKFAEQFSAEQERQARILQNQNAAGDAVV